jgi:hypothetical protein
MLGSTDNGPQGHCPYRSGLGSTALAEEHGGSEVVLATAHVYRLVSRSRLQPAPGELVEEEEMEANVPGPAREGQDPGDKERNDPVSGDGFQSERIPAVFTVN